MADRRVSRPPTGGAAAERAGRALILAAFLSSTAFSFIFPLLPLYVQELAGPGAATVLWSGLAIAATPMAGAVASPLWGWMADRVGHRPMLLRALGTTTVTIGLMALPDEPWQLVLLRALAGAFGSFQAAAMGAMASWSKPEDLSRAISRLQMASVLGIVVGPLVGGTLAAFVGIRFTAVAGAAALAMGTILVAHWFREPSSRHARPRGSAAPFSPMVLWLPMLTIMAAHFTDASFNPILPLLLARSGEDAGRAAALSGLAASLSATAGAAGAALAGRALKRGVRKRGMVVVAGILSILALGAVVAPMPWGLIAVRVLCGGTIAGITIAGYSAGGLIVPPDRRGSAYGWLSTSSMTGYAASPIVAGALAAVDLRAVLIVDAALCLVVAAGWGWSRTIAPAPAPSGAPTRAALPAGPLGTAAVAATAETPPGDPPGGNGATAPPAEAPAVAAAVADGADVLEPTDARLDSSAPSTGGPPEPDGPATRSME